MFRCIPVVSHRADQSCIVICRISKTLSKVCSAAENGFRCDLLFPRGTVSGAGSLRGLQYYAAAADFQARTSIQMNRRVKAIISQT